MIYCQRCKKANPHGADHCEACGAYLLVISRTPDSIAGEGIDNTLEEHLLERISTLESALTRANERFEQLLEIAQQQATGSFYDHMMLESLTELLTERQALDAEELEHRWRMRVARHYQETAERERLDERCERVIAAYRGPHREEFVDQIEEGAMLLGQGRTRRALRTFESALALDEHNAELRFILGEYYFLLGKSIESSLFLRTALEERADHFGARLLLGLLSGDIGEEDAARLHLEKAIALDANSFAAHYGLGRLLAREGKMTEALPHLKRALALNPTPETHYLVGRAYLDNGRLEQALRHLQKAVRLDPHFDVAQYSLGFLYWQTNRIVEARKHLQAAYELKPQKAPYRQAIETQSGEPLPGPPVLGWGSLFPGRKPKLEETRFHDLLWQDLQLHALPSDLAPFSNRRSAGRDLKKT